MTLIIFKQYFKTEYFMLKLSGIWIGESNQIKPRWYSYYSFVALTILFFFNLSLLIDWMSKITNLVEFSITGFVSSSTLMGLIKEMLLLNNKHGLATLLEQLDNPYLQVQNSKELEVAEKTLNTFKKIKITMTIAGWIPVFMFCISPILHETEQSLMFPAWYPFNVTTLQTYKIKILYIHQVVGFIFTGIGYIYADLLMCTSCIFIGLQCSLLAIRLAEIRNNEKNEKDSLFHCIQHHRHILGFYKITNTVFGNMFFWQLFSSTISMCMALFLFSMAKPGSFEFFLYMSAVCCVANILLIPCLFASEMTSKSEAISTAAFNSNWIDGSNDFKKDLMFFIRITQKPLALNFGGFFKISKDTFVAVARATVSYYTALNNLNS